MLEGNDPRHSLHVDGNEHTVSCRRGSPRAGRQSAPILGTVSRTHPTLIQEGSEICSKARMGTNVCHSGHIGSLEGGSGVLVPGGLEQEPHREVKETAAPFCIGFSHRV